MLGESNNTGNTRKSNESAENYSADAFFAEDPMMADVLRKDPVLSEFLGEEAGAREECGSNRGYIPLYLRRSASDATATSERKASRHLGFASIAATAVASEAARSPATASPFYTPLVRTTHATSHAAQSLPRTTTAPAPPPPPPPPPPAKSGGSITVEESAQPLTYANVLRNPQSRVREEGTILQPSSVFANDGDALTRIRNLGTQGNREDGNQGMGLFNFKW